MPPKRSTVMEYISLTSSSSATFTCNANAEPSGHCATVSCASSKSISAAQTFAPSPVKTMTPSRPMPPPAPVITHTLPSSLPAMVSAFRRDEHVLDVRVAVERSHAQLAAEPRLLHAAERRVRADRAVRVDREHARGDAARHAQRPRAVARPDRPGKAVRRVVRDPNRVPLVGERDHGCDGAEHLLTGDPVVVRRFDERAREPEARARGCLATEQRIT